MFQLPKSKRLLFECLSDIPGAHLMHLNNVITGCSNSIDSWTMMGVMHFTTTERHLCLRPLTQLVILAHQWKQIHQRFFLHTNYTSVVFVTVTVTVIAILGGCS